MAIMKGYPLILARTIFTSRSQNYIVFPDEGKSLLLVIYVYLSQSLASAMPATTSQIQQRKQK